MPTVMTDVLTDAERLARKLSWLNDQDLPALMTLRGIKGNKMNNRWCPIARLLHSEGFDVQVTASGVSTSPHAKQWTGERWQPLPPNVVQFVRYFDCGDYPHLIDPSKPPTEGE